MKPVVVKLQEPVQFGEELVEELEIKFRARDLRDFSLPMAGDGKIDFQPYKLAEAGVCMAGRTKGFVDKLSGGDLMTIAQAVLGFLIPSPGTGPTPSA